MEKGVQYELPLPPPLLSLSLCFYPPPKGFVCARQGFVVCTAIGKHALEFPKTCIKLEFKTYMF